LQTIAWFKLVALALDQELRSVAMRNRKDANHSSKVTNLERRSRRLIPPRRIKEYHPFLSFSFWSLRCLSFFVVGVVIAYLVSLALALPIDSKQLFETAYSISWRWFLCSSCALTAYAVWESLRH
jgi:hypothetical protein